jgi:high-affinity nickel permease
VAAHFGLVHVSVVMVSCVIMVSALYAAEKEIRSFQKTIAIFNFVFQIEFCNSVFSVLALFP